MIVKLSARTPLCRAWPSPSTSVDVHYGLSHQPQTDEQKQQRRFHTSLKRPNTSSEGTSTSASNDRIPAAKAAPTSASNDRTPAAKMLPGWPQTTEYQQQRRFHASLKRPNTSSKGTSHTSHKWPNTSSKGTSHTSHKWPNTSSKYAPRPATQSRMSAAKIMIFTKRHNKMPKKPPPEEKESLQAYVRLQASLMIKPICSWSIKPLRESQQQPQREPL